MVNSTASGTGQTRPKVGLTPSAGQVMVGGAAEVAPGVTPASRDPLVGPHQPVHRTVYVLL